jgi:hypothetical protein
VVKFKHLQTTLTNQNCIHEDIKSKLNSGNTYYHSVQNPLPSYLLPRNIKIKINGTLISLVVLCGCETWSSIQRKEYRLEVLENCVLRKIFGPDKEEVTGAWRKLHNVELHNLYSSPNIIWVINQEE